MARQQTTIVCFVCGREGADTEWVVLMQGRAKRLHCSPSCLAASVERQRRLDSARRWRWRLALAALLLAAVGANTARRYRLPASESISGDSPEPLPEPPRPGPQPYGPSWPPTDAEWAAWLPLAPWMYPLPGPVRRAGTPDGAVYAPPSEKHRLICRSAGRCAVDLGGELWGEHVYAALDGVVDRVQGGGRDDHGGQYVRLAHPYFGGMVFTQYFHLAGMPRTIVRGARVKAGEMIGLLGDTGTEDGRKHLYFAVSARPSAAYPEIYWDPSAWMGAWPLRVPPNGSVAGLVLTREGLSPRRHRME
ncbi:MAG TPA: M23 family metallopeptidase [Polyangia bacterium]|jgi:murein DD-endopeptidase MepM/ murein hydrolase activator NlpD|nr:M23 family metallopeptidase [Polyangia bacterium]